MLFYLYFIADPEFITVELPNMLRCVDEGRSGKYVHKVRLIKFMICFVYPFITDSWERMNHTEIYMKIESDGMKKMKLKWVNNFHSVIIYC